MLYQVPDGGKNLVISLHSLRKLGLNGILLTHDLSTCLQLQQSYNHARVDATYPIPFTGRNFPDYIFFPFVHLGQPSVDNLHRQYGGPTNKVIQYMECMKQ